MLYKRLFLWQPRLQLEKCPKLGPVVGSGCSRPAPDLLQTCWTQTPLCCFISPFHIENILEGAEKCFVQLKIPKRTWAGRMEIRNCPNELSLLCRGAEHRCWWVFCALGASVLALLLCPDCRFIWLLFDLSKEWPLEENAALLRAEGWLDQGKQQLGVLLGGKEVVVPSAAQAWSSSAPGSCWCCTAPGRAHCSSSS